MFNKPTPVHVSPSPAVVRPQPVPAVVHPEVPVPAFPPILSLLLTDSEKVALADAIEFLSKLKDKLDPPAPAA